VQITEALQRICLRVHVLRLTDYVTQLCIEASELPKTDKNPRRDRYDLGNLSGKTHVSFVLTAVCIQFLF